MACWLAYRYGADLSRLVVSRVPSCPLRAYAMLLHICKRCFFLSVDDYSVRRTKRGRFFFFFLKFFFFLCSLSYHLFISLLSLSPNRVHRCSPQNLGSSPSNSIRGCPFPHRRSRLVAGTRRGRCTRRIFLPTAMRRSAGKHCEMCMYMYKLAEIEQNVGTVRRLQEERKKERTYR